MYITVRSILFFLFIIILSGCETIDRGLYTVTDTISQKDQVTGERTLSLRDRAAQIKIGNAGAEQNIAAAKSAGKKINAEVDPVAYERVKRIFYRLQSVSHVRDERWTPVLIEDNEWNAYTTGGTYFIVYSTLEKDLKDDSELANVIAHEMGHSVANHIFEREGYTAIKSLSHSKSAKSDSFQAAFSHEQEAEADRIAIVYCALAGYDPYAGERIWKRMHEQQGDDGAYFHNHPMNSERAVMAKEAADKVNKYYTPNQINPDFVAILANNEVFSMKQEKEIATGEGGGLLALLDTAMTTMQQQQAAQIEQQKQQAHINFLKNIEQLSEIISSKPISATSWRVTVKYNGFQKLTDLSFKLSVFHSKEDSKPIVITKIIKNSLEPRTTFYIDFESPDLDAYGADQKLVFFELDNAKAL